MDMRPADGTGTRHEIHARIDAMLAMRRERRLRVQLPLLVAGALLMAAGAALFVAGRVPAGGGVDYRWAYSPVFAGAAIVAIAAMPGDVALLRALCCFWSVQSASVCAVELQPALVSLRLAVGASGAAERAQLASLAVALAGSAFAVAPCTGLAMLDVLARSFRGAGRLHLSSRLLHVLSCSLLAHGALYAVMLTAFRLSAAREQTSFFPHSRAGRVELLACYLLLCAQCTAIGLAGLLKRDLRARVHGWLAMRGVGVGAAAGVAEMLNGVKAAHVLERASKSFRAVSLDDLTYEHFVAGTRAPRSQPERASATAPPAAGPASLPASTARLAELGHVDAFVSHSWHDPPKAKWEALQAWGAAFKLQNGRPPLLWLDKVSIDQADIDVELPFLPVYLAGCRTLLVLHGPSYLRRLWCVVELFVFFQVHLPAPPAERIQFVLLAGALPAYSSPVAKRRHRRVSGRSTASRASAAVEPQVPHACLAEEGRAQGKPLWTCHAALEEAERFDVRDASASLASDEERLLAVIEGSGEAVELFSQWIRTIVVSRLKEARGEQIHARHRVAAKQVAPHCPQRDYSY